MTPSTKISRRAVLRGAGLCLALPALDSLRHPAFAANSETTEAPVRMAFLYVPNGVIQDQWHVSGIGAEYKFSSTLQPLTMLKRDVTIISGLCHENAKAGPDGAGDHARANATFLTGCRAKKTAGADIRLGVSVDQIAAAEIGHRTRLPSLELSTDGERMSGACDSGYSCAYQYNLSWKSETLPVAAEQNPRLVFERLYGGGGFPGANTSATARRAIQKSVLDFVLDDVQSIKRGLNAADDRKLDQYCQALREVERRIEQAESADQDRPDQPAPAGIPSSFREHIRLMFDLMALAFETDTTRISTFMISHDGSNRAFPELGVPEAHHQLSHHKRDPQKMAQIAKIDHFYVEQLAYFLGRLKNTMEGEHSLLDQSMIVFGSGIADGNAHTHDNLPVILAGRGGGQLHPGRHLLLPNETPMTNLYLALLERMKVKAERIGDSSGVLQRI